ncbi:HTH domain-containing protein [Chitinophaga sp. NPDC101104]|uniref:HTH domain-containing protein n=1 Tax=Chitinophaga sp. NPDC101104 TaxID=3390561 RepID=UPI003D06E55D
MHAYKVIYHLKKISQSIGRTSTGTPKELAQKLNICERQVHRYIQLLKRLGAPIDYCRKRKSYYYKVKGHFSAEFTPFEEENIH